MIDPFTQMIITDNISLLTIQAFTIAGPYVWTSSGAATEGGAMGKCQTDTFSATGSLGGSPVICGGNQNQHSN